MTRHGLHLRRFIAALLIGVVMTVLMGWVAMFVPWSAHLPGPRVDQYLGYAETPENRVVWSIHTGSNAWHRVVLYQVHGHSDTMLIPIPLHPSYRYQYNLDLIPRHLQPRPMHPVTEYEESTVAWYHEVGWPLAVLTCSLHPKPAPPTYVPPIVIGPSMGRPVDYAVRGGVPLGPQPLRRAHRLALPLTPVWPGFAISVLIWGSVGWLLTWGIRDLRRWSRHRAGRCLACGYSRTGLPPDSRCPECGSAVDAVSGG